MFPKSGAPMETNDHSRALHNISFGVPSQRTLPPGPAYGVPSERDVPFLASSFIHHSKSPVYKPPPDSRFPRTYRGPYGERCPYLNISSRIPSKGALPRGPPH
jgi:hypothetical protein